MTNEFHSEAREGGCRTGASARNDSGAQTARKSQDFDRLGFIKMFT